MFSAASVKVKRHVIQFNPGSLTAGPSVAPHCLPAEWLLQASCHPVWPKLSWGPSFSLSCRSLLTLALRYMSKQSGDPGFVAEWNSCKVCFVPLFWPSGKGVERGAADDEIQPFFIDIANIFWYNQPTFATWGIKWPKMTVTWWFEDAGIWKHTKCEGIVTILKHSFKKRPSFILDTFYPKYNETFCKP